MLAVIRCAVLFSLAACGGRITDAALLGVDGGTMCTVGPLLDDSSSTGCSTSQETYFATPYTPPTDIVVDRIEAHMTHGDVALLASDGGDPGSVLFSGGLGSSVNTTWLGTDVPQIVLQGGTLYFIGFRGDCSWTKAPRAPLEYTAHGFDGPWTKSGTGPWTARLIGTCR